VFRQGLRFKVLRVWKVMVVTSVVDEGIFFPPNVAGNKINVFFGGYIVHFFNN